MALEYRDCISRRDPYLVVLPDLIGGNPGTHVVSYQERERSLLTKYFISFSGGLTWRNIPQSLIGKTILLRDLFNDMNK